MSDEAAATAAARRAHDESGGDGAEAPDRPKILPCPKCGTPVERKRVGGQTKRFCSLECQQEWNSTKRKDMRDRLYKSWLHLGETMGWLP